MYNPVTVFRAVWQWTYATWATSEDGTWLSEGQRLVKKTSIKIHPSLKWDGYDIALLISNAVQLDHTQLAYDRKESMASSVPAPLTQAPAVIHSSSRSPKAWTMVEWTRSSHSTTWFTYSHELWTFQTQHTTCVSL